MKNISYTLILLGLASVLFTCQRLVPEPDLLVYQPDSLSHKPDPVANKPDLLLDGRPRIKSLTFDGISPKNVVIDQEKFLVTITLPPTISNGFNTTLTLTDSAKLIGPIDWYQTFQKTPEQCPYCFKIALTHQNNAQSNPNLLTTYAIHLLPEGPLTIQPAQTIETGLGELIYLAMFHLYGNALPTKAIFVDQLTGERVAQDSLLVPIYGTVFPALSKSIGNRLIINTNYFSKLTPGQSTLELTTEKGQLLRQSFRFTKASQHIYRLSSYALQPGEWVTLSGNSLYENDVRLSLLDSLDQATPVTNVIHDRYGHQLQVQIPATLARQRYIFHVANLTTGQSTYCRRINWPRRENTPNEISYLSDKIEDCSMKGPVYLRKGSALPFEANAYGKTGQLKLVSIENSTNQFFAYVQLRTSDPGRLPGVLIPPATPSGRYKAYLQIVDPQDRTKVLEEGPAFWRDVEVL